MIIKVINIIFVNSLLGIFFLIFVPINWPIIAGIIKKKLIINNVLILEIDNSGILLSKKFYNKEDMNDIKFDNDQTGINYSKKSFVYNVLSSLRQKIDDPLGKKRIKN